GQLSRDVQREVRNEPPLREHVGPAAALPCLQSNSDAGVVDKTVSRFSHRRRRRITRGDRVSSVHRPGGALPALRTHHSRSASGASDLEVALTRNLSAQGRIRRFENELVIVVSKSGEIIADSPERLAEEKFGSGILLIRLFTVALRKLNLRIPSAQHRGRCKKIHRRARDPFLHQLHVQNWFAIKNQRSV